MFWLTAITTAATFLLLLVGGIVHATGSGLACPDWSFVPMCYGQVFPQMTGGILFEHGHRLFASGVGMLTIAMVVVAFRTRRTRPDGGRVLGLALFALGLVCVQGTLGGLTVLLKLPWYVSSAHLATSMLFFALLIYIAFTVRPERSRLPAALGDAARLVWMATAAVYLQILLGAAVRHLGAGLACVDIPFCTGQLWPSAHALGQLQMIHRMWGVVVAILMVVMTVRLLRAGVYGRLRAVVIAAPILVLLQIAIGLYAVWSYLGILSVTAHLGVAALIWASMALLSFAAAAAQRVVPVTVSGPASVSSTTWTVTS